MSRMIERPTRTHGDFGLTAAQCDHVESFGVPIVPLYVDRAYYLAGICVDSVMPTDEELRQVRSFIEFVGRRIYGDAAKRILAMPLPADPGHNTIVLVRGGLYQGNPQPTEGWSYKRYTWETGLFPYRTSGDDVRGPYRPWGLSELLDGIEGDVVTERGSQRAVPRAPWEKWKSAHTDVFPREEAVR